MMTDKGKIGSIRNWLSGIPLLAWFTGALAAVCLEHFWGDSLANGLGLSKIPVLFGCVIMIKNPLLIPGTVIYLALIYMIPMAIISWIGGNFFNRLAAKLLSFPSWISIIFYLTVVYGILHIWSDINAYRVLTLKLTLIAIIFTLSLNIINGYMGEFSCSHPAFMALGAYSASIFTVVLFVDDRLFGSAMLPPVIGPFMFPLALLLGGSVSAIASLVVAIPSFRTRGDYLAIISLAFMFIVKSVIENTGQIGGARGMSSQPDWANLPTVFIWTILCIWIIHNFVGSTLGKALNGVRDNEIAAEAMTVNTRKTKIVAFMFAAFWAGISGGLFAHVIRYVNPGTFGIQKLAEVLAMVYFGGLNSIYGSIIGAVSLSLLGEVLRPLEIFKWIIIPLLLILVMIFKPTGLIAFKALDVEKLIQPKRRMN